VAGKPSEFVVQVKEIRATVLPTADDAWAKGFGERSDRPGFLRERLKEAVTSQKEAGPPAHPSGRRRPKS